MRTPILYIAVLLLTAVAMVAGCGSDGADMRAQLEELERCNRADSLMTNDSLALALTNYFDRHGTPNEQMRAYYILGRTYFDRGEMPAALEFFQKTAELVDTNSKHCDYDYLCRIYSQIAAINYHQGLYLDDLYNLDQSMYYAEKANDTIAALISYTQKIAAFDRLGNDSMALVICEDVSRKFNEIGNKQLSASVLASAISKLIKQNKYDKARNYMKIYEAESGFFDKNGNIEKGREVYYYYKGMYYLAICRYDSAYYFFRKELNEGKDFNNQNAGAQGLALLYQKTNCPDSAAKYALYSYAMNDSVYAQKSTETVKRMQVTYNYDKYKKQSKEERAKAEHRKKIIWLIITLSILILSICACVWTLLWVKKKKDYNKKLEELNSVQSEVLILRTQSEQFDLLLKEKELSLYELKEAYSQLRKKNSITEQKIKKAENKIEKQSQEVVSLRKNKIELGKLIEEKSYIVENLSTELANYHRKGIPVTAKSIDEKLAKSDIYSALIKKAEKGLCLSDKDWQEISALVIEYLPGFHQFISANKYSLNLYEYHTCILIRLGITPTEIHHMLGVAKSYVTKMRVALLFKLFGIKGTSKEFDRLIRAQS